MTTSESAEAESAKSYTLVGFIFYILGAIGSIGSTIGLSFLWMGDMMSNMIGPFRYSPGFYALIPMITYFILTIGFTIWS